MLLSENNYQTELAEDFDDLDEQIIESKADLVLLDIRIPGTTGERVLKKVRQTSQIPIIMLTSQTGEANEIISMSYGADDFITKPYSPQILLLRIEAVLNRANASGQSDIMRYKNITVYPLRSAFSTKSSPTETVLSKNELRVLCFLIKNHGVIMSRSQIKDYLWDEDQFVDDNTLTVNINRLRRKLDEAGLSNLIQTRRAQGYILE